MTSGGRPRMTGADIGRMFVLWAISTVALWVTGALLPGLTASTPWAYVLVSAVSGALGLVIRPALVEVSARSRLGCGAPRGGRRSASRDAGCDHRRTGHRSGLLDCPCRELDSLGRCHPARLACHDGQRRRPGHNSPGSSPEAGERARSGHPGDALRRRPGGQPAATARPSHSAVVARAGSRPCDPHSERLP